LAAPGRRKGTKTVNGPFTDSLHCAKVAGNLAQEVDLAEESRGNGGGVAQEVAFDYIKGQFFRVIHVDGAIGGITPQGHVHIGFFSERPPFARRIVQRANPDGTLGEAVVEKTVVRDAIVRELDVDVIMTYSVLENLHAWIGQRLEELRKLRDQHGVKQ
jgi:hypothetical protein